jgi:tRNA (guanine37-N1)-methyltransferase
MKSRCVIAPRRDAERLRHWLLENGVLRTDLNIQHDDQFVYLPILEEATIDNVETADKDFKVRKPQEQWHQKIADVLPNTASLTSFDVIGDIAIVRIPPELESYREDIANTILATHRSIKVVCNDLGVKEDFRVRDLQIIGGEDRTHTTHVEHGVYIELDIARVYFSPRLAAERKRIADQVQADQTVIDMFTGVAPFPLVIAASIESSHITAIDMNPVAVHYARRNVQRNKFFHRINVLQGDAIQILPNLEKADHVIMNLPHSAADYIIPAMQHGCMIHYYEILHEDSISDRISWLHAQGELLGKEVTIKNWRKIGAYSPRKIKIAIDLLIG